MSFLNPSILFGLAALSVPVAIHLLHRFQVRRMRWAAMRFLRASVKQTRRRRRVQDLLLLLLRCVVVAALALAFAQPVLRSLVAGGAAHGPGTTVVLLDNSASMGQSDGVQTRFDAAKKDAAQWLDTLPGGSRVALFAVSDVAEALVARPGSDLALAREALQLAEPSDRGGDLLVGFRAAFQALRSVPDGGPREIRVYTDGQGAAWSRREEIRLLRADNPGVRITPVTVGGPGEENLAVNSLEIVGGIPAVGQSCRCRVTVANYGVHPVENVRVVLAADDDPPTDQHLVSHLEPGAAESVDLFVRFAQGGPHSVTATLPPDRFAADNQRSVAVQVVQHVGALLLEGNTAAPGPERSGYFLANALVPLSSAQVAENYLQVTSAPVAGLNPGTLGSYGFVFLCDPGAVTPELGSALSRYVQDGGKLIVFPGPRSDPAQWRQSAAFRDLLPAVVGDIRSAGEGSAMAWQSHGFRHPVTAFWEDRTQGNLGSVRATRWWALQPRPEDGQRGAAQVVAAYADGSAAVVEGAYGRGRVVLFSSTATPEWNNLPLHPAFVPLVQRLLGYLDRLGGAPASLAPGEVFTAPVPIESLGADFSVARAGPDSTKHLAGKVELDGAQAVMRYTAAGNGVYRTYLRGEQPQAIFVVGLDPAESDLRQADAGSVAALRADPPAGGSPGVAAALTHPVVTREFWTPLLWLAALAAAAEAACAHRFSHVR